MLCGLRVGAVDIHLRFCPAVAARSMVESMLAAGVPKMLILMTLLMYLGHT